MYAVVMLLHYPSYREEIFISDRFSCQQWQSQIPVLLIPSHFKEISDFCCGCHHLVFAGMWEHFSQSPTFPVQLLHISDDGRRIAAKNPREEGKGERRLGWWVTPGKKVIGEERKVKTASHHFLRILPRERVCVLPAVQSKYANLESDQNCIRKEG